MRTFSLLLTLSLFLTAGLLSGCGQSPVPQANDKPTVVATTTMIADLARVLAGDDMTVVSIMREGEDPHMYEAKPNDAVTISKADLVLTNGFHLEATLDGIIHQVADAGKAVMLAEAAGIDPLGSDVYEGAPDPHCWMDVQLFKGYAEAARNAMVKADPANAEGYRSRAAAYIQQLDELDAWVQEQLDVIPEDQRLIVTSHDAFNYYAAAYGIEVFGVMGISTDGQINAGEVQKLRNQIKERGIRALFIETSVSQTLNDMVKSLAADTGASIGGTLFSDSLGAEGTEAGTYIGMIRHNTNTVVKALQGISS